MNYPLFLSYKGAIIGNGFVAEIAATGRVLATVEPEGTWLYGVNPGAIAADGRSIEDAHTAIRESLRLVLIDFAQESANFAEFETRVTTFFNETDELSVKEWEDAVLAVRAAGAGNTIGLPQRPAATQPSITVLERPTEQLTPAMNVPALNASRAVSRLPAADADLAQAA